jgi:hypothetical protein
MSPALYVLALVAAASSIAASYGGTRGRVTEGECLRFHEPLGYSASGALEQGDAKWYVLQLADSGMVARPLFAKRERKQWASRSQWTTNGDTLLVRVSDGLVGWDLSLRRGRNGFQGVATYLTDVRVTGALPLRRIVHASKITCPAPS